MKIIIIIIIIIDGSEPIKRPNAMLTVGQHDKYWAWQLKTKMWTTEELTEYTAGNVLVNTALTGVVSKNKVEITLYSTGHWNGNSRYCFVLWMPKGALPQASHAESPHHEWDADSARPHVSSPS